MTLLILFIRWQGDELCQGRPYPKTFDEVRKTMRNWRSSRYEKYPRTADEIEEAFKKPRILEDLGTSTHRSKQTLFNVFQRGANHENLIFSSAESIRLIKESTEVEDRLFLMDATFKITPNSIFKQVLIIYCQFGIKVSFNDFFGLYI